jgi:hypothetical protein
VLLTVLITRELSTEQVLQMTVLVVLEAVVDQTKEWMCHRRGIFVRSVRVTFLSRPWFSACLFAFGIGFSLGLLCGIRIDCYLFGPE